MEMSVGVGGVGEGRFGKSRLHRLHRGPIGWMRQPAGSRRLSAASLPGRDFSVSPCPHKQIEEREREVRTEDRELETGRGWIDERVR